MSVENVKKLNLLNIVHSSEDIQEKVRIIRNEPQIRKWMYTDHLIAKDEHKNWIERLSNESRNIVYVVMNDNDEPIGVVSVNSIDLKNKKADWAYYLTANSRTGVGAVLEFFVIDYVFNYLHLEKLNCEVIEHNDAVVRLHEKFGFKQEGFRESNILKDNKRFGVYHLGLTKEKWNQMREFLKDKYYKIFSQYMVGFYR
ncbi:UDP-4-amino-4,6-dideoxy-N-acetyl-beta-L-altrosamine N-acetyltransferase [Escherichia coli]|nr:UDP-4-amino-4,6-dideoxy-N-acetyl-beta-L-altrosamine N-acetyltransferase [Escherichia coli]EIH9369701.1 UDP-4-amino-4,6-dideoxy-N-acetyl-beta-L-altrosamine N-acetyltransferase [Escherichia coli]ELD0467363.1 UDP-4-amino-4,6-dideoxy-N-acetyl-beta-L-altrosamine N-acetyltransferase [Escherichia coli]HAW1912276.1 UDP-4-amino-4,6-dideoxy-N-acetyl-beta-L-altrosamine N-acetyltransferase [Escherichia coli]HAW2027168.1 UDP-4-amino-4,6-dideoxy-N-acetyl-beta-L-altrosamine N-acetyltransferase [Escherichia